jgi:hypothetical protein
MGTASRTTSGTGSGMGPGKLHKATMMQKNPLSKGIFTFRQKPSGPGEIGDHQSDAWDQGEEDAHVEDRASPRPLKATGQAQVSRRLQIRFSVCVDLR